MVYPEHVDRIGRHGRRRRDFGQWPSVRSPEAELAVGLSIYLIALLVNRTVVPATEKGEVRERRRPAVGPVTDVMALTKPHSAARESATPVPVMQRSS